MAAPAQHCLTSREKLFFGKFRERGARVWPGGASPPNRSMGFFEKNFQKFWKIRNLSGTDAATVQRTASSAMRQTRTLQKSLAPNLATGQPSVWRTLVKRRAQTPKGEGIATIGEYLRAVQGVTGVRPATLHADGSESSPDRGRHSQDAGGAQGEDHDQAGDAAGD